MKYCVECKRPLKTPLDEYGPADAPLCQYHFLRGPGWVVEDPQHLLALERSNIENIKSDIQAQLDLLDALKDSQVSKAYIEDEEEHLNYLQSRLEIVQNSISSMEDEVEEMKLAEARKLEAWKASAMA